MRGGLKAQEVDGQHGAYKADGAENTDGGKSLMVSSPLRVSPVKATELLNANVGM